MSPHACQAIRLQLQSHRKRIPLAGIALLELTHSRFDAQQFLDVMPDFVCNYVRLCEFSGCSESLPQFVVKAEVNVDLLIFRAIKRPGRGLRRSATRLRIVTKEHQPCVAILLARL